MKTFHYSTERDYEIEGPEGDGKGDFLCKHADVTIINDKIVVQSIGLLYWFDRFVDNGGGDHFPHESKTSYLLELHPAIKATIQVLVELEIDRLGDHEYREIYQALEKLEADPPGPF